MAVHVILPQLSVRRQLEQNIGWTRYILYSYIEDYRKLEFMLLHTHGAQSGECTYCVDTTRYHHVWIMQDFTSFFVNNKVEWNTFF